MKLRKTLDYQVKIILQRDDLKQFMRLKLRKNQVYGRERKNILHLACKYSKQKIIKYCINTLKVPMNSKTRKANSLLHYACKAGNLFAVKLILKSCKSQLNLQNKKKQSPLHLATKYKHNEISIYLLTQNPNIHIQDKNG